MHKGVVEGVPGYFHAFIFIAAFSQTFSGFFTVEVLLDAAEGYIV